MRLKPLLVPLVAATASLALLAGCTSTATPTETPTPTEPAITDLSAPEIMAKAAEALTAAGAFHLTGQVNQSVGTVTIPYGIDQHYTADNSTGTLTIAGQPAQIVKFGDTAYIKTNIAVWVQFIQSIDIPIPGVKEKAPQIAAQLDGKWGSIGASLIQPYLPVPLSTTETVKEDPSTTYTKGEVTTLDGKSVITITDQNGVKYFVSTEGEPYLLKIDLGAGGSLVYSDFGVVTTIAAPTDGVVDLLTLFAA